MSSRDRRELSRGGSRRINKPSQFLTTRFDDLSIIGEETSSTAATEAKKKLQRKQKRRPKTDDELMDKDLWLAEAKSYGVDWLEELPDTLRSDAAFMKKLIRQVSWTAAKYASLELSTDEEFILAARLPYLANDGESPSTIMRTTSSLKDPDVSLSLKVPYRIDEETLRRFCGGSREAGGSFDEETYDLIKDDDGCLTNVQLMDPSPQRATSAQEKAELLEKVTEDSGWLSLADADTSADPEWLRAAQHRLADVYNALPAGSPEQLAERYEGYGALNACLASGGAVLVLAQWLVDYANSRPGNGLPRRQDLPVAALYDGPVFELTTILVLSYCWAAPEEPDRDGRQLQEVARVVSWFLQKNRAKKTVIFWDWTAMPQHDAKYSCGTISAEFSEAGARDSGAVGVAFFGHSDAMPMPLAHIRQAPEWEAAAVAAGSGTEGDIMAHVAPGEAVDARIPRGASEQQTWAEGRNNVKLWYANMNTIKLLLTFQPSPSGNYGDYGDDESDNNDDDDDDDDDANSNDNSNNNDNKDEHRMVAGAGKRPGSGPLLDYDARGWPCFERILSRSISDDLHVIDLGRLRAVHLGSVADMNGLCAAQAGGPLERSLPLNPNEFSAFIRTKAFFGGLPLFNAEHASEPTAGASTEAMETTATTVDPDDEDEDQIQLVEDLPDRAFLEFTYEEWYDEVICPSTSLEFVGLSKSCSSPAEWERFFCNILPDCRQLLHLDLHDNPNCAIDIEQLGSPALSDALANLKELYLSNTQITGDVIAIANLFSLQTIDLAGTRVSGDVASFCHLPGARHILLQSCKSLTGNIESLRRLATTLEVLDVDGATELSGNLSRLRRDLPSCTIYYTGMYMRWWKEAEAKEAELRSAMIPKSRYGVRSASRGEPRARTPNLAAFLTGMRDQEGGGGAGKSRGLSRDASSRGGSRGGGGGGSGGLSRGGSRGRSSSGVRGGADRAGGRSASARSGVNPDGSTEKFVDVFEEALQNMEEASSSGILNSPASKGGDGEDRGEGGAKDQREKGEMRSPSSMKSLSLPKASPSRLPKAAGKGGSRPHCAGCGREFADADALCGSCGRQRPPEDAGGARAKAAPAALMRIRPSSDTLGSPLALLNAASRKHSSVELGSAAQKGAATEATSGSPALPSVNYLSKAAVRFNDLNPANPNLKHTRETILERSLKQQQQQHGLSQSLSLSQGASRPEGKQQQQQQQQQQQPRKNRPRYRDNALLQKSPPSMIRGVTPGSNLIASAVFMTSRMVGQDGDLDLSLDVDDRRDDPAGGHAGGSTRRAAHKGGVGVERFPLGSFERGFETGFDDGDVHSEGSPTPLSPTPLGSGTRTSFEIF